MNENDTIRTGEDMGTGDFRSSGLTDEARREAALIQQDMARTRAELTDTLDQIQGQLTPGALKERIKAEVLAELAVARERVRGATVGRMQTMMHSTGDSVRQRGASFADTVQRNPVPSAMIGVGAVWLFLQSRNQARTEAGDAVTDARIDALLDADVLNEPGSVLPEPGSALNEPGRVRPGRSAIGEPGREFAGDREREPDRLSDRIRRAASARSHAAGERLHGASGRVQRLGHDVRERGRGYGHRGQDTFQQGPLLFGAAAIAAGALLGLTIPASRREDALLGKTRDRLVKKAQGRAQDALDKAQDRRVARQG